MRTIRTDPRGFHELRRHAERIAMRWTPCPAMGALAHHAREDVAASRRAIEAGRVTYAQELERRRGWFNAAWDRPSVSRETA